MFVLGGAAFFRDDHSWSNWEHLCRWLFQLLGRALWNKRAPVYPEIQTRTVASIGFLGSYKKKNPISFGSGSCQQLVVPRIFGIAWKEGLDSSGPGLFLLWVAGLKCCGHGKVGKMFGCPRNIPAGSWNPCWGNGIEQLPCFGEQGNSQWPLEIPMFGSRCLEQPQLGENSLFQVFPGEIPSQHPHPPLEIPVFGSGLFITTPGRSKFPFPGFSWEKFLVDASGICWKCSASSLLFLLVLLDPCIHIHVLEMLLE